jgi:glycopeptide antibiotics resistance protein
VIQISVIFIYLILIVIWTVYRIIAHKKVQEITLLREITINIFFVYFLAVVSYTICKWGAIEIAFDNGRYANLVPLKETIKMFVNKHGNTGRAVYNVSGNILLFVPFGFFIPLLFDRYNSIIKVAFYGFVASIIIEIIQYFTVMNITDIDDVIFNTLGAAAGVICYKIFSVIVKAVRLTSIIDKIKDRNKTNIFVLAVKPLSAMAICCGIFISLFIYNNTYCGKLSNEQFAKEVFASFGNQSEPVFVKDFDVYKLFLKDYDKYLELSTFQRGFMNRYLPTRNIYQINLQNIKFGCKVETLYKERGKSVGLVVFGRNNTAKSIVITFRGEEYKEDLKANDFFVVSFPKFKEVNESSDIYNIYSNKPSRDLQIKFLNENGDEDTGMRMLK